MKRIISIALSAVLLLALFACSAQPAAIPNPPLILGEKYLFDMDYEQSILQFDQAIQIDPKNPRAWLGKYAAQEISGQHDAAVQTLRDSKKQVDRSNRDNFVAILSAAETTAEDGLATATEAYKFIGFKEVALALLQLCVKVYEETDRFVVLLNVLEEEMGMHKSTAAEATAEERASTTETTTTSTEATTTTTAPPERMEINSIYLRRIGISYGELKNVLKNSQYEFTHAARYEVWGSEANVYYRFDGLSNWDGYSPWATDDSDRCSAVLTTVKDMIPSVKIATTVKELASALGVSYEYGEGAGTAYYIADRFVEMKLSARAENGNNVTLQIALENGEAITPDSRAWLV